MSWLPDSEFISTPTRNRIIYRGKVVAYDEHYAMYDGMYVPVVASNIVAGSALYLGMANSTIYKSSDMIDFELIGNGKLIGVVDDLVVCLDKRIYIYHKGVKTHLRFYLADDALCYASDDNFLKSRGNGVFCVLKRETGNGSMPAPTHEGAVEVQVEYCQVYQRQLVIGHGRHLLFVTFDGLMDVQYRLPFPIEAMSIPCNPSVKLLQVEGGDECFLYYGNRLVLTFGGDSMLRDVRCFKLYKFEQDLFRHLIHAGRVAQLKNELHTVAREDIAKAFESVFYGCKNVRRFRSLFGDYKKAIGILSRMHPCYLPRLNTCALLSEIYVELEDKLKKIEKDGVFYEKPADFAAFYRHGVIDVHSSAFQQRVYSRVFNYNSEIAESSNLAYTTIQQEKVFQKYSSGEIDVIEAGSTADGLMYFGHATLGEHRAAERGRIDVFKKIHGDSRVLEIRDVIAETSIKIEADINDSDAIRQKAFIARLLAGAGAFFLMCKTSPGYERDFRMEINGNSIESIITEDMAFVIGLSYSRISHGIGKNWSDGSKKTAMLMGACLADIINEDVDEEVFQQYLERLQLPEMCDNTVKYVLFLVAAYKNKCLVPQKLRPLNELYNAMECNAESRCKRASFTPAQNLKTNAILIAFLSQADLTTKMFAGVSLAIYNLGAGDVGIFARLLEECKQYGVSANEHLQQSYNREYRAAMALSASLVSSVKAPIRLTDTFAELIINGMGFIETGTFSGDLQRTNACRVEEVFYSQLFTLMNDFRQTIFEALGPVELYVAHITKHMPSTCSHNYNLGQMARMAASVFYAALKYFYDERAHDTSAKSGCVSADAKKAGMGTKSPGVTANRCTRKEIVQTLLDLSEKVEDALEVLPHLQLLFDFTLVSLSLILNSTFDLTILRILRRRVLLSGRLLDAIGQVVYSPAKVEMVQIYGPRFESVQFYKLCMGIVCLGFGERKLRIRTQLDFKLLVTAFFVTSNAISCFHPLDVLRLLVVRTTTENSSFRTMLDKRERKLQRARLRKRIMKRFIRKFSKLNEVDQKYTVDVLSDYYENYGPDKRMALFDLKLLAKLLSVIR